MTFAGLGIDSPSQRPIILLTDPSRRRQVPILIDPDQAHNIISGFQEPNKEKPLTHDLMVSLLKAGNLYLDRVIIHSISQNAFHAFLKLKSNVEHTRNEDPKSSSGIEINSRPSDAIALALRTKCSIWMLESVFSEASIPVNAEAESRDQNEFKNFVQELSPAEFVKHLTEKDKGDSVQK